MQEGQQGIMCVQEISCGPQQDVLIRCCSLSTTKARPGKHLGCFHEPFPLFALLLLRDCLNDFKKFTSGSRETIALFANCILKNYPCKVL